MLCKYLEEERGIKLCTARMNLCVCTDTSDEGIRKCQEISSLLGFVAPDGTFTHCPFWRHIEIAESLVKKIYNIESMNGVDAEKFLLQKGYVILYGKSIAFWNRDGRILRVLTDAQKDFLEYALTFCPDDEKKLSIEHVLEEDRYTRLDLAFKNRQKQA